MTEDVTATVGGIELDANDLEAALDEAVSAGIIYGDYAVVGEVFVVGDNYDDGDCMVGKVSAIDGLHEGGAVINDESNVAFTRVEFARDAIEEAGGAQFDAVGYVQSLVAGANRLRQGEYDGEVEIQHEHINEEEMSHLADDEAISFGAVNTDVGEVVLSVYVDEQEADEDDEEGLGDLFG